MTKRLVFSNSSPNDQDGIVPNDVIIMDRFKTNPVLLKEHRWYEDPLGYLTDVRIVDGKYSAIPVFHLETQASREASGMWEKGALKGASIGGGAIWKTNKLTGEYERDKNGFKICEAFYLYEVSLVALPSNPDAIAEDVELHAYFYNDKEEVNKMGPVLSQLSSKYTKKFMEQTAQPAATAGATATETPAAQAAGATTLAANPTGAAAGAIAATQSSAAIDDLPKVIKDAIKSGMSVTFSAQPVSIELGGAPKPKNEPTSTQADRNVGDSDLTPIGLAAKAKLTAGKKYQSSLNKADAAIEKLKAKKDEKDKNDDKSKDEEFATSYAAAKLAAEKATGECMAAEEEYNAAVLAADEEEKEKMNAAAGKTTLSASPESIQKLVNAAVAAANGGTAPKMKTPTQLSAELKLAAAPSFKAKVSENSQGVTFTRLNSPKATDNDKRILERLFHKDKAEMTDLSTHGVVLNSILNDSRLSHIAARTRMVPAASVADMGTMMKAPILEQDKRRGFSLQHIAADLAAGRVQYKDKLSGSMKDMTYLTSTDNALASPALNTIEWLSLAIFELFPTTSWKAAISMFGAAMASANTGFIWANIAANPAVYKGTSPAPAADYVYADQAVSLSLTPYWLQPMLWNPLTMHQLRYDQQSTGWAQAFAVLNTYIDDNMLFQLASNIPANSIISTTGLSGYQVQPQTFPVGGPNSFFWNTAYNGSLNSPVLNDVIALEQVYRNQNFHLEREKAMLILDPIAERYLATDPETKNLLTRFVSADGEELIGYKHTKFDIRSRVAMYDLATKQVKDPNGAMPATAVSLMLGFMPSQIGIGVGMLDVFMVQDPANYGYRMSADLRIGIASLRSNFLGLTGYTFATPNV